MGNVVCPSCQGKKRSLALLRLANGRCIEKMSDCPTCEGFGSITEEHELRIKRGEFMRRGRIERGETLREAAAAMGIDYVELSHIEAGRLP